MKKRKKPIFLVAVLALLFVTVAAINSSSLAPKKDVSDVQPQDNAQPAPQPAQNDKKPAEPAATNAPLVAPEAGDQKDDFLGFKSVPAIDPNGPKIAAPTVRRDRIKDPDHAGTRANSGWYMNGK